MGMNRSALGILFIGLMAARPGLGQVLVPDQAAPPREFWLRLLDEARKVREAHPEQFRTTGPGQPQTITPAVPSVLWTNLGPSSSTKIQSGTVTLGKVDSGRVRTLLPHPTDPNTLYVASAHGGLWKTNNFSAATPTWTPLTDFLGSTSCGAVAFGRTTETLYLGMGDPFGTEAGYGNPSHANTIPATGGQGNGGYVFRSADGGTTWGVPVVLPSLPPDAGIYPIPITVWDLKTDTSSAQDIVLVATNNGIARSTDGGATYTTALPNVLCYSLVQTTRGWLAATQAFQYVSTFYNPSPAVFYVSADHGATWTPIANTGNVLSGLSRTTLAVGAPGDAIVYAFAMETNTGPVYLDGTQRQKDLYRSMDGGNTWTALGLATKTPTNPNGDQVGMDIMGSRAIYNQALVVDPSDPTRNTVFIGGQTSSAKTTNGGSTWTVVSNGAPGQASGTSGLSYIHSGLDAGGVTADGRILLGTDGGLFASADGGTTWDDKKNTGLVTHAVNAMACKGDGVLLGLQGQGTRLREGASSVFDQVLGGDGFGVGWSPTNAVALTTGPYGTIFRSPTVPPSDISNWSPAASGLTEAGDPTKNYLFTPLITAEASADSQGATFFTYTRDQAFRTTNGGSTWTLIGDFSNSGSVDGIKTTPRAVMHGAAFGPNDADHMAVAGGGGILLWTELGFNGSWAGKPLSTPAYPGATDRVTSLSAVAYADDTHLYLGSEAQLPNSVHVVKATASATVLTDVSANGNLPDTPVTRLVVDRRDATGNTVLAATWIGLFRTTDGGTTWAPYGTGLPQMPITDIYLSPDGSILRAATFGRGVWEAVTLVPPTFTQQPTPATLTVTEGQSASFTAAATGTPSPTYQWRKNTVPISGATSATLTINPTALADAGAYDVVATNAGGSVTSATAQLTVNPVVVVVVSIAPGDKTLLVGATQAFTATVTGSTNAGVAWSLTGPGTLSNVTATSVLFTASAAGKATLTATSSADQSRSKTVTITILSGDLNGDNTADVLDLAYMASAWGSTVTSPNWNSAADLNGDGVVDDADLVLFFAIAGF